jgi:redox-regulated HSP33 family molecular chaperone
MMIKSFLRKKEALKEDKFELIILTCDFCGEEYDNAWEANGAGWHEPFLCKGQ